MDKHESHWIAALYWVHLATAVMGVLCNAVTFVSIYRHGSKFGEAIRKLLMHQSCIDFTVCAISIILVLQKQLWMTGVYWLDTIVCHVWHSERPYWGAVYLSILNLIAIAVDRHLVVCRPLLHGSFAGVTLRNVTLAMYPLMAVVCSPPLFLLYLDADGKCVSSGDSVFQTELAVRIYKGLGIMTLLCYYILPLIAFVYLYSTLIYTLANPKNQLQGGAQGQRYARAQRRTTLAAMTLTACFIATIALDLWGYALDLWGVIEYHVGVDLQKLGVYLCMVNSVVNPAVYVAFMPDFRRAVKLTLTCSGRNAASRRAYDTDGDSYVTGSETRHVDIVSGHM